MKKLILIIITSLFCFSGFSQEKKEDKDKLKFVSSFDMRNSIVIGHRVKFNGVKLGLGNSTYRFGIGFYGLRERVITTNRRVNKENATDTNRYDFGFISLYYERILYQSKRWEFSAPVHLNFGTLRGDYLNTEGKFENYLDEPASSLTFSVKGHFKVFRWIGFQGGLGYNLMINRDFATRKALNAPFYAFGVKVFLGEAWKLTFNKAYRKSPWID